MIEYSFSDNGFSNFRFSIYELDIKHFEARLETLESKIDGMLPAFLTRHLRGAEEKTV